MMDIIALISTNVLKVPMGDATFIPTALTQSGTTLAALVSMDGMEPDILFAQISTNALLGCVVRE